MTNLHLYLTFLEPFRLLQWNNNVNRNAQNPGWVRAQSFARWHGKRWGRPYITGTLVRSAVIRAVEEELSRSNGSWRGRDCCPGMFQTAAGKESPTHLRHRSVISWSGADRPPCSSRESACPLCHILGRLDKAGKKSGKEDRYDVRFGNLRLAGGKFFAGPNKIGATRLLNRVDAITGKAHDWFRVWEIDYEEAKKFEGVVMIADDLPNRESVISLLERALGFVDRLCGSMVMVKVERKEGGILDAAHPHGHQDGETPSDPSDEDPLRLEVEEFLLQIPDKDREFEFRQRTLADAVRALRDTKFPLSLPEGHKGPGGFPTGHFLWDKLKLRDGKKTLRRLLTDAAKKHADDQAAWRRFCEYLGQKLYERSKTPNLAPGEKNTQKTDDTGLVNKPKPPVSYSDLSRTGVGFTHEWILVGELWATAPFHVGVEAEMSNQTSLRVLLTRDNHFRLPRSTLRGVLRRDLGYVTGQGCMAQLGLERPCQCPVCQIMRRIVVLDAKSAASIPPDIRHRIRKHHITGTVDEGALFDAENGLEGTVFPFLLRFRGGAELPKPLRKVLTWWRDKKLFLGGNAGSGKGRFFLDNLKSFCWNLEEVEEERARSVYAQECGLRNQEDALDSEIAQTFAGLSEEPFQGLEHEHPWREVKWQISFAGPVLSNDPIAALCQDEADAIFYRKNVIKDGKPTQVFALRGEGLRGMVRYALGRADKGLLGILHEDCNCCLCRVFGNEHQEGAVRFEDMTAEAPMEKLVHHVSIDRFDGGVVEKFDDKPLVATPGAQLSFSGSFWLSRGLEKDKEAKEALIAAFRDIQNGFYPVGAKGGIGYGWIHQVEIKGAPEWLTNTEQPVAPQTATNHKWIGVSDRPYPPLPPAIEHEAGTLYNPYYFLAVDKNIKVDRQGELISHESFNTALLTGKISCTLKTKSPLILPDVEKSTVDSAGHRTSPFFRVGGKAAIPGSQIRATVSSVFEALTNSCLRVMKQKNYLSWRMDPGMYKDFLPGKVVNGGKQIKPMGPQNNQGIQRAIRLPLYDDPDITNNIPQQVEASSCIEPQDDGLNKALKTNRIIAKAAKENQEYLRELSREDLTEVLCGRRPVRFRLAPQDKDVEFQVATLTSDRQNTRKGFCKITGPNNANVAKWSPDDDLYSPCWEDSCDYSFRLIGPPGCLPSSQGREFPRPGFTCIKDGKKYRITKRCERIFEEVNSSESYAVSERVREQYRDILLAYRDNAEEIAKAFRTRLPDMNEADCNDLRENDLVYFRLVPGTKKVAAVIPVCISREADDRRVGERLPDTYRPCAHVCLEDCTKCDAKSCSIPLYREGALPSGLCPACHLFGVAGYKGRVRFGFAKPKEGSPIKIGPTVTLPLQERARPTWVLPKEIKSDGEVLQIPGRKFYLRHDAWKVVLEGTDPMTSQPISKGVNNVSSESVMPGAEFTFDIYFENFRPWELGLLLYSIELEEGMAHMLGRGKPFGFGQISISVNSLEERVESDQWQVWDVDMPARDWKITREGLNHLVTLCGASNTEWSQLPHVAALRLLLKVREGITARYPALDDENTANPPGYKQLKENGYKAREELIVQLTAGRDGPSPSVIPWHCSHASC